MLATLLQFVASEWSDRHVAASRTNTKDRPGHTSIAYVPRELAGNHNVYDFYDATECETALVVLVLYLARLREAATTGQGTQTYMLS